MNHVFFLPSLPTYQFSFVSSCSNVKSLSSEVFPQSPPALNWVKPSCIFIRLLSFSSLSMFWDFTWPPPILAYLCFFGSSLVSFSNSHSMEQILHPSNGLIEHLLHPTNLSTEDITHSHHPHFRSIAFLAISDLTLRSKSVPTNLTLF